MLKWIYSEKLDLNEFNNYLFVIEVFKLSHSFELHRLMSAIEQLLI
jgi:hypothetical protein